MNQNDIKFQKYIIKKINFVKLDNKNHSKEKRENKINMETNYFVNDDNDLQYCLNLTINITTEEEAITIVMDGYFEFGKNTDEELIENFLRITAPAILYPYCRSFISTITSLNSEEAIILPVINFANI